MARDHQETDDKYARESFTFRTVKNWQLWGITAFAVVVIILGLTYGIG